MEMSQDWPISDITPLLQHPLSFSYPFFGMGLCHRNHLYDHMNVIFAHPDNVSIVNFILKTRVLDVLSLHRDQSTENNIYRWKIKSVGHGGKLHVIFNMDTQREVAFSKFSETFEHQPTFLHLAHVPILLLCLLFGIAHEGHTDKHHVSEVGFKVSARAGLVFCIGQILNTGVLPDVLKLVDMRFPFGDLMQSANPYTMIVECFDRIFAVVTANSDIFWTIINANQFAWNVCKEVSGVVEDDFDMICNLCSSGEEFRQNLIHFKEDANFKTPECVKLLAELQEFYDQYVPKPLCGART